MSKFDEQRHSATIFMVNETETGALQLIGSTTDTDEAVVLTINSKKFDAENRKYVDDAEALEAAEERVKSLGAKSWATAQADFEAKIDSDGGFEIEEVYVSDGRASFNPIKNFSGTQWAKIDAKLAKALKAHKGETFETLPIEEFDGYRFNIGVNVDGHNVRVSQFVFADENGDVDDEIDAISLKYTNKKIDGFREMIKEGKATGAKADALKKTIDKMIASSRKKKVAELSDLFGQDFEEMIENGTTFEGQIVTQKIPSGQGNYYAQLVLDTAGEAEDEDE